MNDDGGPVPEDTRYVIRILSEFASGKEGLKDSLRVRLSTQAHTFGAHCS